MNEANRITVLIIDDSYFMRKLLADILESDAKIKVIGTAKNGKEGLKKIKELKPKVVTLDYEMPEWNGIETLRHIIRENPVAVVMLSAYTGEDAEITLQALREGAVDYVLKPSGAISWDIEQVKSQIIQRIKAAALIDIAKLKEFLRKKALNQSKLGSGQAKRIVFRKEIPLLDKVVVIGASTGGPQTLELILKQFPKDIPSAILIVQHMPKVFTKLFAERLNSICDIQVKEAEQGEIIKKGIAYVAPGGWHMRVKSEIKVGFQPKDNAPLAQKIGFISLTKESPVDNLRPSIDILMKSVAKEYKDNAIGVVLTGMGRDGAEGIRDINEEGGKTIAQNEESSLIFGMPKRAIETGAVKEVLGVENIAGRIMELLI